MRVSLPPSALLPAALGVAAALACAGPGGATLSLEQPAPDACGNLTARVIASPAWREREITLLADGAVVARHTLAARTREATLSATVGGGRSMGLVARIEDTFSEEHAVTTPPFEAALGVVPPEKPFPADGDAALTLQILTPCSEPLALMLDADIEPGGIAVSRGQAVSGRVHSLSLPKLPQGRYAVMIRLRDVWGAVDERRVPFVIGPPCVDRDGDGYLACAGDCDDANPLVHPGAQDLVGDGIDNDCDGVNGQDRDGDGHEAAAVGGDDCDDANPLVHPGQLSPPDQDGDRAYAWVALDWNCDGVVTDAPGPWDCDDNNPEVPGPEKPEPNGIDDDCDGLVDEGTVAFDDDGDGLSERQGDCNDADATVYPGAPERADCKDNDCDGQIDEGIQRPPTDDVYEPNDTAPHALSGARQKKPILGIPAGYNPTWERLLLTTRDRADIERFSLWTHDGPLDTWHVTAKFSSMGDGRSYDVTIAGNGRTTSGTVHAPSGGVSLGGRGLEDNTGTYEITITPREGDLPYCPVVVEISSG